MKLRFPFPLEVRNLYLYKQFCILCGSNGNERGGLELHHLLSRISDSAFNSAVLCGECHKHIGHSQEEHQRIFSLSFLLLHRLGFKPKQKDIEFLQNNWNEIMSEELLEWWKSEMIVIK